MFKFREIGRNNIDEYGMWMLLLKKLKTKSLTPIKG